MAERQKHILVVEDEELVREMLHGALADAGYAVTVAANAAEARATLTRQDFDAVLLDGIMPGEVPARVAEDARALRIPVLLMSGHPDAIVRWDDGAAPFIAKPFRMRQLLDALSAVLKT